MSCTFGIAGNHNLLLGLYQLGNLWGVPPLPLNLVKLLTVKQLKAKYSKDVT
jgi:hypothetical protein